MSQLQIRIVEFNDKFSSAFAKLNIEWLEQYFTIEKVDRQILNHPKEYIIDNGGQILFALINNKPVGTVALIKREEGVFELSKMAVTDGYKGNRIGQKLMYASIHYAGQNGIKRLFLDSNTTLVPAITLYKKVGFKEVDMPNSTAYKRSNIRMELLI